MIKKSIFLSLLVCAVIAVLGAYIVARPSDNRDASATGDALIGGAFRLEDMQGKIVTESILHGHYSLVYFGFTYCPDICPATLMHLTHALEQMPEYADQIQPIFITLDPQRDTPEVLRAYQSNFHPSLIMLRGTLEQTKQVADAYKVFYQKEGSGTDYSMNHTGYGYVMDTQGKYITHITHDDDAKTIEATLRNVMVDHKVHQRVP
ncbi:MAG: SCO family protein [Alphaproteobacteria bacterium]|nr:MAG: SCO family protein [Alphaproteobacteria bacterium]TAF75947.1 MAG: SCO family protein [Alphaproteobacteria bacterium]